MNYILYLSIIKLQICSSQLQICSVIIQQNATHSLAQNQFDIQRIHSQPDEQLSMLLTGKYMQEFQVFKILMNLTDDSMVNCFEVLNVSPEQCISIDDFTFRNCIQNVLRVFGIDRKSRSQYEVSAQQRKHRTNEQNIVLIWLSYKKNAYSLTNGINEPWHLLEMWQRRDGSRTASERGSKEKWSNYGHCSAFLILFFMFRLVFIFVLLRFLSVRSYTYSLSISM